MHKKFNLLFVKVQKLFKALKLRKKWKLDMIVSIDSIVSLIPKLVHLSKH